MGEPGQRSGQRVAHYDILEQLGAGGMGVVYRALDTRLNRTVAVKFLPHQLGIDPQRKARFLQEARAAAALDHSNVGTVHSIEETPDGQIFLVMAYYDGRPLSALLNQRRLSPAEALAIAIQIARGLAAAHRQGIIHRDIKPSNVIITRDGTAKIVDFGLARFSGSEHITETGATVGTAAYMAPEQALGLESDGRAPAFSLEPVVLRPATFCVLQ